MAKRKILVVEDEVITAMHLSKELGKHNLEVLPPTGRGDKAIDLTTRERPDIILLDINLGSRINGIDVAREIIKVYRPLIIFISGYHDEKYDEEIKAFQSTIIHKPLEISKIIEVINEKIQESTSF